MLTFWVRAKRPGHRINRSCRPEVVCKKGVLRTFAKFTGKYSAEYFLICFSLSSLQWFLQYKCSMLNWKVKLPRFQLRNSTASDSCILMEILRIFKAFFLPRIMNPEVQFFCVCFHRITFKHHKRFFSTCSGFWKMIFRLLTQYYIVLSSAK